MDPRGSRELSNSLQLFNFKIQKNYSIKKICLISISLLIVANGPNFREIIESLLPEEKGTVKRQQVKGRVFTLKYNCILIY